MLRGFVCAFALLLLLPAPARAEAAPEQPEKQKIIWPLPWHGDSTLEYDQTFESVNKKGEITVAVKGSDIVRISIERADSDGFVQRWVSTDPQLDVDQLPVELRTVMKSTAQAFKGLALDVQLDKDGTYKGLINLAEVQPRYRNAMLAIMTKAISLPDAAPKPEATAMMIRMVDMIAAPAVVEAQFAEEPVAYNFIAGGGLALDTEYEYEDQGANPLGGQPIRMVNTMSLNQAPDPAQYEVRWRVVPDAAETIAMIKQFTRELFKDQKDMPVGEVDKVLAQLSMDADFSTTVTYQVSKVTGIVERMEKVQIKKFGSKDEFKRTVMSLRQ